ncbi:NmrA family NAD(P)-binding protein [Chryseobacterium sp. GVT01B]|uniref:NmrA family NAD(P)-binding protein n=1 Tax=Chryseobacterium sp. GVT01B TaxID=2862675 RepID=UPI001CC0DACF|nr:NAD(P)H-binding protein [Chryseobacterium sp. GVT01B]
MKIVLTGSVGPISKPLAEQLITAGHEVTVISSQPAKKEEIELLGAIAAIGSIEDINFLSKTFAGADAAYLMEPTVNMFDPSVDLLKNYEKICNRYIKAVMDSGLKRVVHLSSIGGHSATGNGMLAFHFYAEQAIKKLPEEISVKTLRPVSFYSNILSFIPMIKEYDAIITSYHAETPEPWVSPLDIAAVAAEELVSLAAGREVRYIVSDELNSEKLTRVLGEAIGKEIQWIKIAHDTLEESYKEKGMSPQAANGFARLNQAKDSGSLYEDLINNKDKITYGKVKIEDFIKDFTKVYQNS